VNRTNETPLVSLESKSSWVSAPVDARVKETRKEAKISSREGFYETTNIFEGKECQRERVSDN
jgi:hypothetical protein